MKKISNRKISLLRLSLANLLAIFSAALLASLLATAPRPAIAQQSTTSPRLAQDVRDMFERLVDDLEPDLAAKFRQAIKNDSAVIEFSPEQFRRFRSNPINPFDGLDDVDARDGSGNIALKFELPSLRQRTPSRYERQHPSQHEQLRPVIDSIAASTVAIFERQPGTPDRQVALGIIVDAGGLVITKASEIETDNQLICYVTGGLGVRTTSATVVRIDQRNDVALLELDLTDIESVTPVKWSDQPGQLGTFLVSPNFDGSVLSLGTYSSNVRSTVTGEQAFLGVQPQTSTAGVVIQDVRPGSASYAAGLRDGDVIFKMAGQSVRDVAELVHLIRSKRPGDRILIDYRRDNRTAQTTAELAGRRLSGERASRFKMMNRLGAIPSRRDDGFPVIFQHDSPLFPEECGGPIVDLEGNLIGMNIARFGRAATYAIPADYLQTVVANLIRPSVASRPLE